MDVGGCPLGCSHGVGASTLGSAIQDIQSGRFNSVPSPSPLSYDTLCRHEADHEATRTDIAIFVDSELRQSQTLRDEYMGDKWPPLEVEAIVERSPGLFVVAAAITRYITHFNGNRIERLKSFGRENPPFPPELEMVYRSIVEKAFPKSLIPSEHERKHACLSLLVVSRGPLCLADVAALLDIREYEIRALFRTLNSVVRIPPRGDDMGVMDRYRPSFVEFLTASQSAADGQRPERRLEPWNVDEAEAHGMVAKHCFRVMNTAFRMNMATVPPSSLLDFDSEPCEADSGTMISPEFGYACPNWSYHLCLAEPCPLLRGALAEFTELGVLFWIEVMTVLGAGTRCEAELRGAGDWAGKHENGRVLCEKLRDAASFAKFWRDSTVYPSVVHLYTSAVEAWKGDVGLTLIWREGLRGVCK